LIVERVRCRMRRARLDGQRIGRPALPIDREALVRDRAQGYSLRQLAKLHAISRTSVIRALRQQTGREA
jgi:DNA invertase Pin-like site-specific DNA recombinase